MGFSLLLITGVISALIYHLCLCPSLYVSNRLSVLSFHTFSACIYSYGYVTNTKVKFMIVVDDSLSRDPEIKAVIEYSMCVRACVYIIYICVCVMEGCG